MNRLRLFRRWRRARRRARAQRTLEQAVERSCRAGLEAVKQHAAERFAETGATDQTATPPLARLTGHSWAHAPTDVAGLNMWIRTRETAAGLSCSAVMLLRDQGEVTARDLRRVRLGSGLDTLARESSGVVQVVGDLTKPVSPGPVGHDAAHWQRVWDLYQEAQRVAPQAHIKWMRERFSPSVPDATMRRWVERAQRMAQAGALGETVQGGT